ncbi:nuclear transport factor 2 family protein [Actinoplanes sp. CA-051413]|uniref:nuclear transport factor 2 family protein n=1 Tax=Actinoplanes sp. CA-051413 TaxID=3239899 RepID=UPI003D98384A
MGNPTITAWRTAGENGDATAAATCLAPEVEMISPLTAQFRFHGPAQVTDVLTSAFEVIHDIRYHTEVGADDTWALFYHGMARREPVEEAQLLRLNGQGLIREITFFGRPLPALTEVMAGIGPRLLRRQRQPGLARLVGLATAPLNALTKLGERTILPRADPSRRR